MKGTFHNEQRLDITHQQANEKFDRVRSLAGKPNHNAMLMDHAQKVLDLARATEFKGKVIKMLGLAGGIGKKKAFQKLIREFGDMRCPVKCILPPIYKMACELAGTRLAAPDEAEPAGSQAASSG